MSQIGLDAKIPRHPLAEDGTPIDPAQLEQLRQTVPGAGGKSPLHLPPIAWLAVIRRVWLMTGYHNLSLLAAGIAYYSFLAFIPLLASVMLVYGLAGNPETVAQDLRQLESVLPHDALPIVRDELISLVLSSKTAEGIGLVVAILFSLYGSMGGAWAMIATMNVIYEELETRSFLHVSGLAMLLTCMAVAAALIGVVAISLFTYVTNVLSPEFGSGGTLAIQAATWFIAAVLISLNFAAIFRFAPDRRPAKWRWLSIGSIAATLLWLITTLGFGFYVANVARIGATYGSLAAIVVFLMWLYFSAYAVLLGAELNSELERQTFIDSTVGPDRPIGWRGAVMADSIVIDRASRALLAKKRRREASERFGSQQ